MTTEQPTTPSVVSRRTILRTGANAAWMVPAISIATAVPAMAACSTATTPHFTAALGAAGPEVHPDILATRHFTQPLTVEAKGTAGSAAVVITLTTGPTGVLAIPPFTNPVTANFNIDVSGWSHGANAGLTSGTFGRAGSTYTFTRPFSACGEISTPTVTVTYDDLATGPKPVISAAVTP